MNTGSKASDPAEPDRDLVAFLRHLAAQCHVPAGEVDDLVQEVWVRITPRLARLRRDHSPRQVAAWLYRVVHNQAINHVRRKARHPVRRLSESLGEGLPARGEAPEAGLERSDRQRLGRRVLDELRALLSEENFRILHLAFAEGRSNSEIARALGLDSRQVRRRKHRALKKAREHFRSLSGGGVGP